MLVKMVEKIVICPNCYRIGSLKKIEGENFLKYYCCSCKIFFTEEFLDRKNVILKSKEVNT